MSQNEQLFSEAAWFKHFVTVREKMTHSLQAWPRLVTIEKRLSSRELLKSHWRGQESLIFGETEAKNWEK